MFKSYNKIKSKKAFTLIELLVTIAVLAILVLIAIPRLTGYTQKAELVRIQHDTKVMEQEMKQAMLDDEVSLANWDDNAKDLGTLVLKNQLFEKEGFAERVDRSHLERHYNRAISVSNGSSELGVGGTEIPLFDDEQEEMGDGYKVIPDDYKSKIKTRLNGTFYTNELGKVYYEHDKPLTSQKDSFIKKCDSPVAADLGYTFNYDTMTIEDYDHREQHLVIPASFRNPETDECVPVRIIGKGAFMIGGYKSVVIPESVHTIEEEAFINNEFTEVYIPHSVAQIGNGAFTGDYISSVTIGRREGSVNIGGGAFYNRSTGRNITPQYKTPSAKSLGYVFDTSRGAIVSHSSSNKVLTIPSVITVNGVEYEVKQIDKGAFQGLGLITVSLPEGLERIEDYAFSGNQLIGVTIPESVVHIGNYAFSFNEQTHSLTGEKRATIKSVMMYEGGQLVEQFENINQHGDILENSGGPKVNLFDGRVTLLDHIFVTSIENHVVDEKYGEADDGIKLRDYISSNEIVFSGLSNKAYDGNFSTAHTYGGTVTWEGDLTHRVLKINAMGSSGWWLYGNFVNEQGQPVRAYNMLGSSVVWDNTWGSSGVTKSLVVPEGAVGFNFRPSGSMSVFEIWAPETLERPQEFEISHTATPHSITLEWEDYTHAVIHKDGVLLGEVTDGNSFTDRGLYGHTEHTYDILFIDKNGNGQEVQYTARTTFNIVALRGLEPETFGPNKNTSDSSGSKTVYWLGDLSGHTLRLRANGQGGYYGSASFYDDNGNALKSVGFNNYNSILQRDLVVPEGATRLVFSNRTRIYNVYVLQ